MRILSLAAAVLAFAGATAAAAGRPASIWRALSSVYAPKPVTVIEDCRAQYRGDRFALIRARVAGRLHLVALHLLNRSTGWVAMWWDGKINRRIGPSNRPLVLAEVTRLKAKCLAP